MVSLIGPPIWLLNKSRGKKKTIQSRLVRPFIFIFGSKAYEYYIIMLCVGNKRRSGKRYALINKLFCLLFNQLHIYHHMSNKNLLIRLKIRR